MAEQPIKHHLDLPEGSVPISVVEMVEYLDPETGQRVYGFRHAGCSAVSTTLGLIDLMKDRVRRSATYGTD